MQTKTNINTKFWDNYVKNHEFLTSSLIKKAIKNFWEDEVSRIPEKHHIRVFSSF